MKIKHFKQCSVQEEKIKVTRFGSEEEDCVLRYPSMLFGVSIEDISGNALLSPNGGFAEFIFSDFKYVLKSLANEISIDRIFAEKDLVHRFGLLETKTVKTSLKSIETVEDLVKLLESSGYCSSYEYYKFVDMYVSLGFAINAGVMSRLSFDEGNSDIIDEFAEYLTYDNQNYTDAMHTISSERGQDLEVTDDIFVMLSDSGMLAPYLAIYKVLDKVVDKVRALDPNKIDIVINSAPEISKCLTEIFDGYRSKEVFNLEKELTNVMESIICDEVPVCPKCGCDLNEKAYSPAIIYTDGSSYNLEEIFTGLSLEDMDKYEVDIKLKYDNVDHVNFGEFCPNCLFCI